MLFYPIKAHTASANDTAQDQERRLMFQGNIISYDNVNISFGMPVVNDIHFSLVITDPRS
ncbi:hypothetical protein P5673_007639 [Acropora cervicornis]|uniref:Uncharacterized protein n=1 Tax=Acropora cervicornis TaxID=6130 RepID=A0AAD9VB22_ACRCE|nr:hypothetical protein P5673_007639 [Acropora cervicornis]